MDLWHTIVGTASNHKIKILQRHQNKTLRLIVIAPKFISNKTIHNDLHMPTIKDEIKKNSENYLNRLSNHCKPLVISLLNETEEVRTLKRYHILD